MEDVNRSLIGNSLLFLSKIFFLKWNAVTEAVGIRLAETAFQESLKMVKKAGAQT